jgi:SPP1 gp7 family putative phage head morphogenesis protein
MISARSRPRAGICRRLGESDPYRVHDPKEIEAQLKGLDPRQRETFWKLYRTGQARLTDLEKRQSSQLLKLFKATAEDLESDLAKTFGKLDTEEWDLATMRRAGRDKALFDQIKDRIKTLGGNFKSVFDKNVLRSYRASYVDNAFRLDKLTPESVAIKFDILPDREILALMNKPFQGARFSDRLGLITDDMAHTIQQELTRSMMAGENWRQASKRIMDEMGTQGQRAYWRSEMIARTELARAQEIAAHQLYDENADVIEKVVWTAHPGACEICQGLHGAILKKPEDYPPSASHPNCVCDAVAIPKSFDDLADGDDDRLPPQESLKDWAKDRGAASAVGGTD